MESSADFWYGVASVIGLLSLVVAAYGIMWKVPVTQVLGILKEFKDMVLLKADKIKEQKNSELNKKLPEVPKETAKDENGALQ